MSDSKLNAFLANYSDIALAGIVIAMVGMMIVPLPTFLLDLLLSLNITIAITLLLISLYIPSAVKISAFPSILLITTLFRLALNVSSTRLILLQADAGSVIDAFGNFVVAGNYVVGAVIFLILTIIQFLVIAKGSERVSEVAARFTLDAMPGKQMSIDADLRAGAITQDQARSARFRIQQESQLYGAMDGAMKFVKGDAIAGIIITTINIIAGMVVGVIQLEMGAGEAAKVYTILTIGDGLVSQIPALLIATTSGIIVTRVASETSDSHLGSDIFSQVFAHPKALAIASVLLIGLAIIPGLPTVPFLVLGGAIGLLALSLRRAALAEGSEQERAIAEIEAEAKSASEQTRAMFPAVTPLMLDLGSRLTQRLGTPGEQALSEGVSAVREGIFHELGVKVPGCRIRRDVSTLDDDAFRILIDEVEVVSATIPDGRVLTSATLTELAELGLDGIPAQHPMSGRMVAWIDETHAAAQTAAGFRVWSAQEFPLMQLAATLKKHASEFVGIQEVQAMLDQLEGPYPAIVSEVVPKLLSLPEVTEVLRRLVEEEFSIRHLKQVLEILADRAKKEKDPIALVESIREGLSRYLTDKYSTEEGLVVYVVDNAIEEMVASSVRTSDVGTYLALPPDITREILTAVTQTLGGDVDAGRRPVVLTDQRVRRYLKKLIALQYPQLTVLSFQEIEPAVHVQPVGRIAIGTENAAS